MTTIKKLLIVFGRLPLLFLMDCVLKGHLDTMLDFDEFLVDFLSPKYLPVLDDSNMALRNDKDVFILLLWFVFLCTVSFSSLILVCSPIESLLEVYGCCLGFGLLIFSYHCNAHLLHGISHNSAAHKLAGVNNTEDQHIVLAQKLQMSSVIVNMLTQFVIVLAFNQLCIVGTLYRNKSLTKYAKYPMDMIIYFSLTMPVFLHSFMDESNFMYNFLRIFAMLFPLLLLLVHTSLVAIDIVRMTFSALRNVRNNLREIGFDGVVTQVIEKTNLSWLLKTFFITKVVYQIFTSKLLSETDEFSNLNWSDVLTTFKLLVHEVLHSMCGTILSVMSMASIVSVISGVFLNIVYKIIGARNEEESLQPAVSGLLFVLLAMQTGITSTESDKKLQLLFQNCILLVVANQHFVQTVAADLVIKASTDDIPIIKHLRPMLPYVIFFSFPFLVVVRLWEHPFRMSWLLAISAFSLELIIKSIGTLTFYSLNMLQSHVNYLRDNIEDCTFYIKAVCGCLEFSCGIFLFFNGAYIFFFESGGLIRLVMMTIHFYCNIYQTAVKGLTTYRLRQSAWKKMNSFQAASQEQLDENDDICSICYQEMTEAVVIKCSHVFHRYCLQKWLTIQEKCPLCHVDLSGDGISNVNNAP